jgi:hypothetical protein
MSGITISYSGVTEYRTDEVAELVGLHLNALATGRYEIVLKNVTAIRVGNADGIGLQQSLSQRFENLTSHDRSLASSLRVRLLHQLILATLMPDMHNSINKRGLSP